MVISTSVEGATNTPALKLLVRNYLLSEQNTENLTLFQPEVIMFISVI